MYAEYWWRNLKENYKLEDLVLDGRITLLKPTVANRTEVDWIYVAYDKDM
jgi:hypothetical protein